MKLIKLLKIQKKMSHSKKVKQKTNFMLFYNQKSL